MPVNSETTTLLREMELVHQSVVSYQPATSSPPILGSSADAVANQGGQQHLYGLRPFLEAVKSDIDVVKQVLSRAHSG
jgi:hypothetical protein